MTLMTRSGLFIGASLSLILLTSCQTTPPAPPPEDGAPIYTARGNEPGWILKMDGKTLDYEGDYGETKIRVPAPEPRPSFNGMRHVTDRLTVDITYSACADDMSGKRFTDTVSVIADGKQVSGCGGRPLPPESLDDTVWMISMLDQMPTLANVKTEIRFSGGRITGTAGCNRVSGTYSHNGNILTFGDIAATRMMCPEKQMAQEARVLQLLKGKVTKRYTVNGELILANETGQRMTLTRML
jgi:heat shock protein HslJ